MRLLLDTHIYLWSVTDSRKLTRAARNIITAAAEVYVSAASIWEIAIKARSGKIAGDARELAEAIEPSGFHELPVTTRHAATVARLPSYHADPFDRLLIAQATTEPMQLLTADSILTRYSELVSIT